MFQAGLARDTDFTALITTRTRALKARPDYGALGAVQALHGARPDQGY